MSCGVIEIVQMFCDVAKCFSYMLREYLDSRNLQDNLFLRISVWNCCSQRRAPQRLRGPLQLRQEGERTLQDQSSKHDGW